MSSSAHGVGRIVALDGRQPPLGRRSLWKAAGGWAWSAIVCGAGCARPSATGVMSDAGSVDDYVIGVPHGFVSDTTPGVWPFWVLRRPNGFVAFAAVCTHLAPPGNFQRCTVVWLPERPGSGYYCPCHRGYYGREDGEPLLRDDLLPPDYPAGRPLDTLTVAIKDRRVLVRARRGAEHRRKFGEPPPIVRF